MSLKLVHTTGDTPPSEIGNLNRYESGIFERVRDFFRQYQGLDNSYFSKAVHSQYIGTHAEGNTGFLDSVIQQLTQKESGGYKDLQLLCWLLGFTQCTSLIENINALLDWCVYMNAESELSSYPVVDMDYDNIPDDCGTPHGNRIESYILRPILEVLASVQKTVIKISESKDIRMAGNRLRGYMYQNSNPENVIQESIAGLVSMILQEEDYLFSHMQGLAYALGFGGNHPEIPFIQWFYDVILQIQIPTESEIFASNVVIPNLDQPSLSTPSDTENPPSVA